MKIKPNIAEQVQHQFQYALKLVGEDVLVNCVPIQVLISAKKPNENYDGHIVFCLSKLATGDIIEYQDSRYLVISEVASARRGIYKALIRKLHYNIAINSNCYFVQVPCFFDSKGFDITGKYIPLPEGKMLTTIPVTQDTNKIALSNRFIKLNQAWKIIGIDKSMPGIIVLTVEKDAISDNDDLERELAGVRACVVQITIEPVELQVDETLQLTWTGPIDVTFTSSNEQVATVSDTGLVTAIGAGSVTITIATDYSSDSITLTVAEPLPSTVTITGDDSIRNGMTADYTADQEVSWQVLNEDYTPTTKAEITKQTPTTCTVKANAGVGNYVLLVATLLANPDVKGELRISLLNLF